jgi:hypothetical protein
MKIQQTKLFMTFVIPILTLPLLAGCGGGNNSASDQESICTTFSSAISLAESKEKGLMEMNRILGGSETQISPTQFDVLDVAWELATLFKGEGITYDSGLFNAGAIEKFLDIAGQCLSDDTYQFFANYID